MMIEKLSATEHSNPHAMMEEVEKKMNEVIDAVNDLLIVHPKLQESVRFRKDIEDNLNETKE